MIEEFSTQFRSICSQAMCQKVWDILYIIQQMKIILEIIEI